MRLSFDEMQVVQNGTAYVPSGRQGNVTVFTSSSAKVKLELIARDTGEALLLADLEPGSHIQRYSLQGYDIRATCSKPFAIQANTSVALGEHNSGVPVEHSIGTMPKLSRQEEIRRVVARTLQSVKAMPTEEQLEELERDLEFDFFGGDDQFEFGTEELASEMRDIQKDDREHGREDPPVAPEPPADGPSDDA